MTASYISVTNTQPSSLSPFKLSIHTTNSLFATNQEVTYYVRVQLDNYPSAGIAFEPFTIKIKACQLTALTKDADATVSYNIYTPVVY